MTPFIYLRGFMPSAEPRVKDRCIIGCCEWSILGLLLKDCTGKNADVFNFFWKPVCGDLPNLPSESEEDVRRVFICCYVFPLAQAVCAVDCIVGPIIVNGADCCLTACCESDMCEQRLCSERHWSLWLPCCGDKWPLLEEQEDIERI